MNARDVINEARQELMKQDVISPKSKKTIKISKDNSEIKSEIKKPGSPRKR